MKKQTHHIQKQRVILDFSTEKGARHWNKNFSAFYSSDILPSFNSLLDHHSPDDRIRVIDRLEIDLGSVHMDEFLAAFLKETEAGLKRVLKNGSNGKSPAADGTAQEKSLVRQGRVKEKRQTENPRFKNRKELLLECLTHFLDHGVLPWNSEWEKIAALEREVRREIGTEYLTDLPGFRKRLERPSVRRRLYFQFSPSFVAEIFHKVYRDEIAGIVSLQQVLKNIFVSFAKNATSRKTIRSEFSEGVVDWIGTAAPAEPGEWPLAYTQWAIEKVSARIGHTGKIPLLRTIVQEMPASVLARRLKALYPDVLESGEMIKSPHKQKQNEELEEPPKVAGQDLHPSGKKPEASPAAESENSQNDRILRPGKSDAAPPPDEEKQPKQARTKTKKRIKSGSGDLKKDEPLSETGQPGVPVEESMPPGDRKSKPGEEVDPALETPKTKSPGKTDALPMAGSEGQQTISPAEPEKAGLASPPGESEKQPQDTEKLDGFATSGAGDLKKGTSSSERSVPVPSEKASRSDQIGSLQEEKKVDEPLKTSGTKSAEKTGALPVADPEDQQTRRLSESEKTDTIPSPGETAKQRQAREKSKNLTNSGARDLEKGTRQSKSDRPGDPVADDPAGSTIPPEFREGRQSEDPEEPTETTGPVIPHPGEKPHLPPGSSEPSATPLSDDKSSSREPGVLKKKYHEKKEVIPPPEEEPLEPLTDRTEPDADRSSFDAKQNDTSAEPAGEPGTELLRRGAEGFGYSEPPEEPEAYYLRHAGIILCWPFLGRLFKQLGYLENQTFKDDRVRERAVHLLGYIATGLEQREEPELVMEKFLCAWPLQKPISKGPALMAEEKNRADQMLKSLITNWSVLKNTSVEGLQSSFFRRDGKLFQEEEQWKLIVEQKSYDMLLNHLPYPISIIKLPWMEQILKTDWT